jgi:hypothetical protein
VSTPARYMCVAPPALKECALKALGSQPERAAARWIVLDTVALDTHSGFPH